MRLIELFEAANNEVAIIFGRFNPPHKGHKAAWEIASQSPVWYVGTNKSTQGPKDPLPFEVKVEAMKTVWPEVENHIIAETSWLTLASLVYKKHGDVKLKVLTDEDWVTKTLVQYNGKEGPHGVYNFSNIEQTPTPRLSSATALRAAVEAGDRDAFTKAAGVDAETSVAGKPFFDLVAEYLLPYQNAPKKVSKKKEKVPENLDEIDRRGFLRGLGAAALAGTGMASGAAKAEGPLPVMATIKFKLPNGEIKTIKKDLGHSYDYRLDDAKKDLENLLDRKGIKNYSIHLDRYKDNQSDSSQPARADYMDKGPATGSKSTDNYIDKGPYKGSPSKVGYLDKSKSKEFRDMDNY